MYDPKKICILQIDKNKIVSLIGFKIRQKNLKQSSQKRVF